MRLPSFLQPRILAHAVRFGAWVCLFMASIMGVLMLISRNL